MPEFSVNLLPRGTEDRSRHADLSHGHRLELLSFPGRTRGGGEARAAAEFLTAWSSISTVKARFAVPPFRMRAVQHRSKIPPGAPAGASQYRPDLLSCCSKRIAAL